MCTICETRDAYRLSSDMSKFTCLQQLSPAILLPMAWVSYICLLKNDHQRAFDRHTSPRSLATYNYLFFYRQTDLYIFLHTLWCLNLVPTIDVFIENELIFLPNKSLYCFKATMLWTVRMSKSWTETGRVCCRSTLRSTIFERLNEREPHNRTLDEQSCL